MPDFRWSEVVARYVNLSDRPDRRAAMEVELSRVGLDAERFDAFRPVQFPAGTWPQYEVMRQRTPGAIGCHASQRALIVSAADSGRNTLILEDDVYFCDDLRERMAHAERFLAGRPWDILSLAGTYHLEPVWHAAGHPAFLPHRPCACDVGRDWDDTDDLRFRRVYGSWFTYAYIVNGSSALRLVKLIDENVHQSIGIDALFMGLGPRIAVYAYVPGCAMQRDGESDIGNRLPDGRRSTTTFSHFMKLGPHVSARRAAEYVP